MKQSILVFLFCSLNYVHGFILTYNNYQVKDHTEASVNIASNTCSYLTRSDLKRAVEEVIEDYWNTVSESELKLKYGSDKTISSLTTSTRNGPILVACGTASTGGITYTTKSSGKNLIIINDASFQEGTFYWSGLIGLLAHEIGHALGLHHSKDPASVMTYEDHDWRYKPKFLSQDDKDGIAYIYPRESSFLGLLGGCEAIAAVSNDQASFLYNIISFLFSLIIMITSVRLLQVGIRKLYYRSGK